MRHHDLVKRSRLAVSVASAALVLPFAGMLALAGPAAAADYQMRIVATGLSPASLTVRPVDRVVFTNATANSWRVTVGSSYDIVLFPGQSADGAGVDPDPYTATALGTYRVAASSPARQSSFSGTIVVRSAATSSPAPTPAPTTSSPAPKPPPAPGASSTPTASSSPAGPAPLVTASPSSARSSTTPAAGSRSPSARPLAVGPVPPPSGPAGGPAAQSSQALSGPVQHFGNSGVALPGAVASVLLAGLVAAIVRVLLAEPVEERGLR